MSDWGNEYKPVRLEELPAGEIQRIRTNMKLSLETFSWVVGIELKRLAKLECGDEFPTEREVEKIYKLEDAFQKEARSYLFSNKYLNKVGILDVYGGKTARKIKTEGTFE